MRINEKKKRITIFAVLLKKKIKNKISMKMAKFGLIGYQNIFLMALLNGRRKLTIDETKFLQGKKS